MTGRERAERAVSESYRDLNGVRNFTDSQRPVPPPPEAALPPPC